MVFGGGKGREEGTVRLVPIESALQGSSLSSRRVLGWGVW